MDVSVLILNKLTEESWGVKFKISEGYQFGQLHVYRDELSQTVSN